MGKKRFATNTFACNGNMILPEDAKLTLENCTLEIVGDYSRQHSVEWKGGTLVTKNCTVGGFVNEGGTAIHTVFHLYEGLWEATDTTVSYSYGISFHWEKGKGVLRGTRLKAGPRPDAIIFRVKRRWNWLTRISQSDWASTATKAARQRWTCCRTRQ